MGKEDKKPIPLTPDCRAKVQEALKVLQQAQRDLDVFIGGIKIALDIPDTWVLDLRDMCFKPQEPPKPSKG